MRNSSRIRDIRGFSLIQMMVAITLTGILATAAYVYVPDMINQTRETALAANAEAFNRSGAQFVSTGGEFRANQSADEVLLSLQTPVDAISRKAGFGVFDIIDHRLALRPISSSESGPRLTIAYNAAKKRPEWTVATTGDGYLIEKEDSRPIPAAADWTARVDRAGQTAARSSKWVWDHEDKIFGSHGSGTNPTGGPGGGFGVPPSVTSSIWIDGTFRIITPGTYYWTGNTTQLGTLNILVDGSARAATNATQVQSVSRTFAPGDTMTFVVTVNRAEGGALSKLVEVAIPFEPTLEITGPDTVTTLDPVQWTATSDLFATPIRIKIEGGAEKKAENVKTITTEPTAFPAGTKKQITISASALNSSGLARASKIVTLDVIAPPQGEWVLPPELSSGTITARGSYTFIFRTTAGGPGKLDANADPMAAPMYSGDPGILPVPVSNSAESAMEIPVVVDLSQVSTQVRYTGFIRLTATFKNPVDTITVVRDVPIEILRSEMLFNWTLEVVNKTSRTDKIEGFIFLIQKNGDILARLEGPGNQRSYTVSRLLPVGEYVISGGVTYDGGSYPVLEALQLSVTP